MCRSQHDSCELRIDFPDRTSGWSFRFARRLTWVNPTGLGVCFHAVPLIRPLNESLLPPRTKPSDDADELSL
jgi:hypothetical protein